MSGTERNKVKCLFKGEEDVPDLNKAHSVCTYVCIWVLREVSAARASWQSSIKNHPSYRDHRYVCLHRWPRDQSIGGTSALSGAKKEQVVLWLQVLHLKGHPGQNERHFNGISL